MRGLCLAFLGLIPAHAGKTSRFGFHRAIGSAHPRSRGENQQGAPDHVWPVGSSPLTRGKPQMQAALETNAGLIPAHAGKTIYVDWQTLHGAGSSPLTRGKLQSAHRFSQR